MWEEIILWHLNFTSSFNSIRKYLSPHLLISVKTLRICLSDWTLSEVTRRFKNPSLWYLHCLSQCNPLAAFATSQQVNRPVWTERFLKILVHAIRFWCWKLSTHVPYKFIHFSSERKEYCLPPPKKKTEERYRNKCPMSEEEQEITRKKLQIRFIN